MYEINVGDYVVCYCSPYIGVAGTVVKKYYPTASEQQTMIKCGDGREFHAPTRCFVKYEVIANG